MRPLTVNLTIATLALAFSSDLQAQQNGVATGRSGGDQPSATHAAATSQKPISVSRRWYNQQRVRTVRADLRTQPAKPIPQSQEVQQRQKDAQLLKLQQADSNLQQQLQDNQLQTLNKTRQAQQNEPRIQSAPTAPPTTPIPGPNPADRIQDAPTAPSTPPIITPTTEPRPAPQQN